MHFSLAGGISKGWGWHEVVLCMHQRTLLPQMGRQNQQIKNFWKFETFGVLFYYCRKQSLKAKVNYLRLFLALMKANSSVTFWNLMRKWPMLANPCFHFYDLQWFYGFFCIFTLCIWKMMKGCVTTKKSLRLKDTLFHS